VAHRNTEIVLIDPWNELDRARKRDEMMTDYIGRCLMLIKDFCRSVSAIVVVVAHPTKAIVNTGNKVVSLADIEGSMNWYNKCDNGLIVVREAGNHGQGDQRQGPRDRRRQDRLACSFEGYVDPLTGRKPIHPINTGATAMSNGMKQSLRRANVMMVLDVAEARRA
jgi:hypothetical protein